MLNVRYRMEMARTTRLGREDWVRGGLIALSRGGPDAVAIEPLATALGATKGSGYWHWTSRAALLDAVLSRWLEVATTDVVAAVEAAGGSARERLERLLGMVTTAAEKHPGEMLVLVHPDPAVRAVVTIATRDRVDYVSCLLHETGLPKAQAAQRALLAYAAYIGHAQLAATVPAVLPKRKADRQGLQQALVEAITAGSTAG